MTDSRTVSVRLKADVAAYIAAMKKASQSTSDYDKQQRKSQASAEKWRAIGMASKIGGAALAAGLLAATKAASDQEQAMGALTSVFKTNGAQMTANAKNATQMGLSTTDYANAAAKLGSQLSNLGVDQKDLGGATDDLIKKAGDLAAQFGGTTQEAVDALGAAMRGEADPAERYGLALNITAVNAEEAATGADRAGAMMSLLNKQMAKSGAVGAMGREFDTAAAATQRAQAEFDNAAASLGEALLPAMAKAAEAVSNLFGLFNGLSDEAKNATTYVVGLGAVALLAGPKLVALGSATTDLAAAMLIAGKNVTALKYLLGTAALGGTLVAATGAVTGQEWALDNMAQKASDATGVNRGLLDSFNDLTKGGMSPAAIGTSALSMAGQELAHRFTGTTEAAFGLRAGINAAGDASKKAAGDSNADAEAKENQAAATKKATEAYEAYIAAVQEALGLLSAKDAMIGQEERLAEAVKKNGAALKGQTKEAAANREAIATEVTNVSELVDATYKNVAAKKGEEAGLRAANRVRKEQIANLLKSAEAAGMDRSETRKLLGQLNLLKPIRTTVNVDGLDTATEQAKALARALQKVVNNSGLGGFGFGQNRAAGGYITGPGSGTSDSIPANLSNGEYVLKASAVKRIGVGELNRMNYAGGGVVGYAKGGKSKKPGKGGQGNGGLGNVQKWTDAVKDARDNLRDIKQEAADFAKSVADNILSGTGLFDMFSKSKAEAATEGLASAQDKLAEASRKVAAAQIAVNTAAPEDRAAAIKDLADAQRELGDAQTEQAKAQAASDAAAPTPANIMGRMKARADAIEQYASKVKTLMGKGLSMGLIKELAGSDMTEAGPVLDALLSMSPEALKQLGAVDKRAKDAAASIGDAVSTGVGVPGGGAFGGKIGDAKAELGVSTDGLDKAIRLADKKYLDKGWRKVLAKAGLSAEERVQLMQSLKANDGKLTKHWRAVLAKAGLSAEERGDLLTAINGADTTVGREWRDKLQETGLSAKESDQIAAVIAGAKNPSKALRRYWIDELQETGLTAKESSSLATDIANTKHPSKALYRDWIGQLQETGLTAKEAADMVSKIQASNKTVNDNYTSGKDAVLGANKSADFSNKITGANTSIQTDYQGKDAVLDNKRSGTFDTTNKNSTKAIQDNYLGKDAILDNKKSDGFGETNKKATQDIDDNFKGKTANLDAKADKTGIAAAIAVGKKLITDGFDGFKVKIGADVGAGAPVKPPKKKKARGGYITGPGTGTSDSILAALSNGEYVVRASSVAKYGTDMLSAINTGRYANGGPVGFRTTTNAPMGGAGGVTTTSVPVIVQLDSRAIATGQLKLQRQSGGTITVGG